MKAAIYEYVQVYLPPIRNIEIVSHYGVSSLVVCSSLQFELIFNHITLFVLLPPQLLFVSSPIQMLHLYTDTVSYRYDLIFNRLSRVDPITQKFKKLQLHIMGCMKSCSHKTFIK